MCRSPRVPQGPVRPVLLCCALLALCSPASAAQDAAAVDELLLRGTVVDQTGAPIAGASVTVQTGDPGPAPSTRTDARGQFAVAVPPGAYLVTAQAEGFDRSAQRVAAGRTPGDAVFALAVSGIREQVNVDALATYFTPVLESATRTPTLLRDVPQAVSVVSATQIADQRISSMAGVVRYIPGAAIAQGEGNRDTPILRGNSSTADFFVDGIRDDVQYFRDVYNLDRVEALKGPNAMIFGRGGGGGVINRVTRRADWSEAREITLQAGSWGNRRLTADVGRGLNERVALRGTVMYENSDSYRNGVGLERYGINPTIGVRLGARTTLHAGYEHFRDERTADRGVSSFGGRPVASDPETFFGDPDLSESDAAVHRVSAALEHRLGPATTLRNRVSYGDYDKFYQNVFPGPVSDEGTSVSIRAYNNATTRRNLFNQTDLVMTRQTGRVGHTILLGGELGRQVNDGFRQTGYFTGVGPGVTSVDAPLSDPTISVPVEFRQSAIDADNHGVATTAALYAQDQLELSPHVQAVIGLRLDSFRVDFRNNRTGADFQADDLLVSPRAGLIYKPVVPVAVYGSYSVSYLPRAGEQLTSLSLSNQALDPEEFRNYELGLKWDVTPAFAFTAAVYRLTRGNVVVPDPDDPGLSILVDGQRTRGLELEVSGRPLPRWTIAGGYAYQDGSILQSLSASAPAGARLAQLPEHAVSLWNKYDLSGTLGVALGVIRRGDVFTSTDNAVVLPGYVLVDAAVFVDLTRELRVQINVENALDEDHFPNAHNNTNITPGAPRALTATLITRF